MPAVFGGAKPYAIVLCRAVTGLATVRSLHRAGVRVLALVFSERDLTRYTRCADVVVVPEAAHGGRALIDWLAEQAARLMQDGGRPVVIPTSDEQALLLAEHAEQLAACCRVWTTGHQELTRIVSKDGLYAIAEQLGVPTVPSITEPTLDELRDWSAVHPAPYFLKPFYVGVAGSRMRQKNLVLATRDELLDYVERHGSHALIVQRLLRGGDGYVFDCYGVCDAQGRVVQMATHRRWRQFRPDCGATSFGEIPSGLPEAQDRVLIEQTRQLLGGMRYHGIFGIEWLLERDTGRFYVIDFNARPFMSLGHLTDCGLNLPALTYDELIGQLPRDLPLVPVLRHLWWVDLLRDLQTLRELQTSGRLSWGAWLRSVLRCRSAAYLDWRDPVPGLLRTVRTFGQVAGFAWKKLRRVDSEVPLSAPGSVRSKSF